MDLSVCPNGSRCNANAIRSYDKFPIWWWIPIAIKINIVPWSKNWPWSYQIPRNNRHCVSSCGGWQITNLPAHFSNLMADDLMCDQRFSCNQIAWIHRKCWVNTLLIPFAKRAENQTHRMSSSYWHILQILAMPLEPVGQLDRQFQISLGWNCTVIWST